jgi:hypothetical protein
MALVFNESWFAKFQPQSHATSDKLEGIIQFIIENYAQIKELRNQIGELEISISDQGSTNSNEASTDPQARITELRKQICTLYLDNFGQKNSFKALYILFEENHYLSFLVWKFSKGNFLLNQLRSNTLALEEKDNNKA